MAKNGQKWTKMCPIWAKSGWKNQPKIGQKIGKQAKKGTHRNFHLVDKNCPEFQNRFLKREIFKRFKINFNTLGQFKCFVIYLNEIIL